MASQAAVLTNVSSLKSNSSILREPLLLTALVDGVDGPLVMRAVDEVSLDNEDGELIFEATAGHRLLMTGRKLFSFWARAGNPWIRTESKERRR
jgi:hypothetical protein